MSNKSLVEWAEFVAQQERQIKILKEQLRASEQRFIAEELLRRELEADAESSEIERQLEAAAQLRVLKAEALQARRDGLGPGSHALVCARAETDRVLGPLWDL